MQGFRKEAIERYLASGRYDAGFHGWPGEDFVDRKRNGRMALIAALMEAIRRRTPHADPLPALAHLDVSAFSRAKVAPMVRGLFPRGEQEVVLDLLARSVVFVTPANVGAVLEQMPWLTSAWELANLYLAAVDAELLAPDAPCLVGLSVGTTCYVSPQYFEVPGRFDDFLVHEAAHVFHSCKRRSVGLPETQRREWLLEIEFAKRETFAYACEVLSRIHALAHDSGARRALLAEYEEEPMPADDRVEPGEYLDILREAVAARNGWKHILERCAPPRRARVLPPRAPAQGSAKHEVSLVRLSSGLGEAPHPPVPETGIK